MTRKLVIAPTAVVALMLLGACGAGQEEQAGGTQTDTTEESTVTTEEQSTTEDATSESSPDQEESVQEEEPPQDETGTRDNPLAVGTEFTVGDYTLTVGATAFDQTEAIMQAEADELYDGDMSWVTAPEEGNVIVVAPVEGAYNGDEAGDPAMDLSFDYVGPSGKVYDEYTMSAAPADDIWGIGEMYAGTDFTASITQEVPEDDAEGGVWRIRNDFSFDSADVFISTE